jgi:ribosomal protein S18 acetylase RimI-like enzyme
MLGGMKQGVRVMAIEDYASVRRLWEQAEGVGLSVGDDEHEIARFLLRNPGLSFVAERDGEVVGAVICGHDGRRGYIQHLAVDAQHRRGGIGAALIDACLDALREIGIGKCHIFLFRENDNGRAFWDATGWLMRDDLRVMSKDFESGGRGGAGTFVIEGPIDGRPDVCERVLRALPHWFGIESSTLEYIEQSAKLPMFIVSRAGSDEAIGFLSIRHENARMAEAFVLGVLPEHHRSGAGRAMFAAAERWLASIGVRYLQVKTVGPSSDDEPYARTRRFYESIGFTAVEEFPTLWDERNPCLLMIKHLG